MVFTRTLDRSKWRNTALAKGRLPDEIARLKGEEGKDIIVYGGPTFVSSLIRAGPIDEFHLLVNPTALGTGRSMFKDIDRKLDLCLEKATAYDCGVVVLNYRREK